MDLNTLLLGAILGSIVGIPFGYFVQFTSPLLKSYWDKRSLSLRERRLDMLFTHYSYIRMFREGASLDIMVFRRLARGLVWLVFLIYGIGVLLMFSPLLPDNPSNHLAVLVTMYLYGGFCGAGAFNCFRGIVNNLGEILYFEEFRKKIIAKIEQLGGNPEDLDKEETE